MNLMKLLTVGQSLQEGKTVLGKYKLTQQSLLPKFVSTLRPVRTSPFKAPPTLDEKPSEAVPPAVAASLARAFSGPIIEPEVSEMKESGRSQPIEVTPPVSAPTAESQRVNAEETQKIAVGTVLKRAENDFAAQPRVRLSTRLKNTISGWFSNRWPVRSKKGAERCCPDRVDVGEGESGAE